MLKKILVGVSALAALVLVMAGCAGVTAAGDDRVSLGQEFTLPVGQVISVSGESLAIKFLAVTADSRCPKGAQCIWAGEAKSDIQITYQGETSTLTLKESGGTTGFTQAAFKGYKISFRLQPYPEVGNQPAAGDYKLLMKVERA